MIYLFCWTINYVTYILHRFASPTRLLFLIPLLMAGAVVFFCDSGTDLVAYESIVGSLYHLDTLPLSDYEPGFLVLSSILLQVTGSEVWSVRCISAVLLLLLVLYLARADMDETDVLALYFVPFFLFPYGMNAIRTGLAMAFLLLAWQALRRRRILQAVLVSSLAVSFHYSIVLPILLLFANELSRPNWRVFLAFLTILFAIMGLLIAYYSHVEEKFTLYQNFQSPSIFSGVSRFLILLFLYACILFTTLPPTAKRRMVFPLLVLPCFCQAAAWFSYAGLRLLDLVAFVAPLLVLRQYDHHLMKPDRLFRKALFLAGLAGAFVSFRNFVADYGGRLTGTSTPFLPYRTIFHRFH